MIRSLQILLLKASLKSKSLYGGEFSKPTYMKRKLKNTEVKMLSKIMRWNIAEEAHTPSVNILMNMLDRKESIKF